MNDRITIRINLDIGDPLERFHREQEPPMASKQDCYSGNTNICHPWLDDWKGSSIDA